MPKTKLKPVMIRIQQDAIESFVKEPYPAKGDVTYLCIPFTTASRKAMIEAIEFAWMSLPMDQRGWEHLSEAALSALESMAKEKP